MHPARNKRVAIVLSNPAQSTTTGWPCGFWWSELTHPYHALTEAGHDVEVFSAFGGDCEADAMSDPRDSSGYSANDLATLRFVTTPSLAALVRRTRGAAEIRMDDFDAIIVAGGQAPMFTFENAIDLQRKFVEFFEAGKVAAALCHGSAILRYARLSNGEFLAKGRTVTGFTNTEEDHADHAVWSMGALARDKHVAPWRIEDELTRIGARFTQGPAWEPFVVRDANLVTGQQNNSGTAMARSVMEAMSS